VVADVRSTRDLAHGLATEAREVLAEGRLLVDRATVTEAAAAAAVVEVTALAARAESLLARYEPALDTLAPLADRVAGGVTEQHADALVDVLQQTPAIVDRINDEVLPVLDSLGTVAPDLREVLDVSQGLEGMLESVPGLGRAKRRADAQRRRQQRDPGAASEVPASD
jgi:hypothetical protein